jgi:hypothetical protein
MSQLCIKPTFSTVFITYYPGEDGGGLYLYSYTHFMEIRNNILNRCSCLKNGGGMYIDFVHNSPSLINNQYYDCSAGSAGGALWFYDSDYIHLGMLLNPLSIYTYVCNYVLLNYCIYMCHTTYYILPHIPNLPSSTFT